MRRLMFVLMVLFSLTAAPVVFAGPSLQASTKKAEGTTGIEWNVAPDHAIVFLDGKKLGTGGDLNGKVTKAAAGKHTIKLTKGGDEQEIEVKVTKGQVLRVDFSFSE